MRHIRCIVCLEQHQSERHIFESNACRHLCRSSRFVIDLLSCQSGSWAKQAQGVFSNDVSKLNAKITWPAFQTMTCLASDCSGWASGNMPTQYKIDYSTPTMPVKVRSYNAGVWSAWTDFCGAGYVWGHGSGIGGCYSGSAWAFLSPIGLNIGGLFYYWAN